MRWGERAPRTRKKVRSVLMSFFRWAQGEFKLPGNKGSPADLQEKLDRVWGD